MPSSEVESLYARAQAACRQPMLALLARRDAPLIFTLLKAVFVPGREFAPVAAAHAEINQALAELRAEGHEMTGKSARELCRGWVEAGWLVTSAAPAEGAATKFASSIFNDDGDAPGGPRGASNEMSTAWGRGDAATNSQTSLNLIDSPAPSGEAMASRSAIEPTASPSSSMMASGAEVYRLTSQAHAALGVLERASGGGAKVSKSRLASLLAAVDQLAGLADPSADSKVARLRAEIDQREAEIAQLVAGGAPETPAEQLLEAAEAVLLQVRELPEDFARVQEAIKEIQRDTVAALRGDDRPTGEVLRDYLARADHLMEATPEGRAFGGALAFLDDADKLARLRQDIGVALDHHFARALTPAQLADLAGVGALIEGGLAQVLAARRRSTHVITAAISHLDPMRDRQVDTLLREVISGLSAWAPASRRGELVEPARRLPRAALGRPRGNLADLGPVAAPAPLAVADPDPHPATLAEARIWGGPDYGALENALQAALHKGISDDDDCENPGQGGAQVARMFDGLPKEARRPVDLVGLLELAAAIGLHDDGEVATVTARRPDGSEARLAFEAAAVAPGLEADGSS